MQITVALLLSFSSISILASEWPQWLGPQRDGIWREDGIVKKFDGTTEELSQKLAKIGQSYSFTLEKGSKDSGMLSFKTGNRQLALAIVEMALS